MEDITNGDQNEHLNALNSRSSALGFSQRKLSRRLDILQQIENNQRKRSTYSTYITYLKVLLSKDYLTLWRNKGFLLAFLIMPVILMYSFVSLQTSILNVNGEFGEGSLVNGYFQYSTNNIMWNEQEKQFVPAFFGDISPLNKVQRITNCLIPSLGIQKYNFTKIAVVSPSPEVRGNASLFFKDYVYKVNQFPEFWEVDEFESMDDLFDLINRSPNQSYCFGLNFIENNIDTANDIYDLSVEFSFNKGMAPDTNSPPYDPNVMSPDFASFGEYVQTAAAVYPYITEFIGRYINMNIMNDTKVMNQTFPFFNQTVAYAPMSTQKYIKMNPESAKNLAVWYPFFIVVIELIPFYYLCSKLSSEKENKSREGMKMMGLPMSIYYLSVFIFYLSIAIITSFIVSIITVTSILKKTEFWLYFFFCLVYSISFFGVAFGITAILPTKRSSSVASTLYHIVSYYMSFAIMDPATASSIQYSLSLFPNLCMNQCIKQFFWQNLNTYNGARWQQINITYQGYSLQTGLQILCIDCFLCIFLGLYLDQVIPSQFGSVKKWNFLCQRCCSKKRQRQTEVDDKSVYQLIEDDFEITQDDPNFERVSDILKQQESENQCLQIKGLRKVFGDKVAVSDTNMSIYSGQIFALLGHNGAGKTTTISMLTGLIQPTEGQAFINGSDIFKDMEQLRKVLGVCPQHNVLFDFLTPLDHLRLFATFKGVDPSKIEDQVQQMIQDIELVAQKDQLTKTLSGGQKRKLSVAIALIGDSKLVMLDEPTSGMDATSRRKLWDMLKKYKQNRIIILTTHYMDEADILGDRIAIMAEGRVVCIGSSLFLKKRFGVGYNLVISKKSKSPSPQIDDFVNQYLNDVQKMQEVSKEIQYQIPTSSSDQFKTFFEHFDQNLQQLGIKSYGVGITTLEEVFLKIGHGDLSDHLNLTKLNNEEQNSQLQENQTSRSENGSDGHQSRAFQKVNQALLTSLEEFSVSSIQKTWIYSFSLFFLHLKVLLMKRLLMMVRDRKTLIIDLLFPLLLIFVGLFLTSTSFYVEQNPAEMSPLEIYPKRMKLYQNEIALGYPREASLSFNDVFDFYQDYIIANDPSFEYMGYKQNTKGVYDPTYPSIIQSLEVYDKNVYDQVLTDDASNKKEVLYGQYYVQKINDQHGYPDYQIACILNTTSRSAVGSWGSYIHEVMMRKFLVETMSTKYPKITPEFAKKNFKLSFINRPFPLSKQFEGLNKTFSGTNSALLMAIAWMMISESILRGILKEKKSNIKHQILVSGGSLAAYWLANYLADVIFHALAAIMAVIGSYLFGIGTNGIYQLFILLVFANPLFLYFLSFFFATEEGGSFAVNIIYFISGIIAPISISVLQVVSQDLFNTAQKLRWYFYPVPIFSLTYGYMSIINIDLISYMTQANSKGDEKPKPSQIWDSDVAGPSYFFLQYMSPFFFLMIILFEAKIFQLLNTLICSCRKHKNETFTSNLSALHLSHQLSTSESLVNGWRAAQKKHQLELNQSQFSRITGVTNLTDAEQKDLQEYQNLDELYQEEINIENAPIDSLPVRVHKLRKSYGKVVAVDKVSFGLEYGECFALLGVSGAGKTNCFKCLTGEVQPSGGQVTINGNDVSTPKGFMKARQQIGYCPQFDIIFDGLTVKEHLQIYAALKGIPHNIRDSLIMKQIKDMDLDQFVDVRVETLSGGNKRKVSMSIAIIGNPPIVFLDEPSTGVDPQAKRFMWDVIAKISSQSKKSAVIITTHAMEEAEALCSKMGIMVAGSFRCFGSSQFIKDKYGTGYEIEFKIENLTDSQISDNIKDLGFKDTKFFTKNQCVEILKIQGRSILINQVCPGGIGEFFHKKLSEGLQVPSTEFMRWQHTEFHGDQVLTLLETKFTEMEELEHYGSSWKIKTSKDDLSIGYIFGMFEDLKHQMNIIEYSVNQTTLEQIFNNFATEKERSQSRISIKGLDKRFAN